MSEPAVRSLQHQNVPRFSRVTDWSWVRDLRHVPTARLHSRRRRAARAQLEHIKPRSILFICHGNICRSPFAAAAFARLCPPHVASSVTIASAGFIGPNRTSPSKALAAASRFDIDLSNHRSALITSENLRGVDLVVVMSEDQARDVRTLAGAATTVVILGDLDPSPIDRRTILDPWGGPDSAFDASYERIDRCVRELAEIISSSY